MFPSIQVLVSFKDQINDTLKDARQIQDDYRRRFELHRSVSVPSPFFDHKLQQMSSEARELQARALTCRWDIPSSSFSSRAVCIQDYVAQLSGSVSTSGEPAPDVDGLRTLLDHQKQLFDQATAALLETRLRPFCKMFPSCMTLC